MSSGSATTGPLCSARKAASSSWGRPVTLVTSGAAHAQSAAPTKCVCVCACVPEGVHAHVKTCVPRSWGQFPGRVWVFQASSDASSGDPQRHDGAVPDSV